MNVKASVQQVQCTHCGLPVPAGLVEPDREEQFCCHGCEGAYELIHSSGLGSFYKMTSSGNEMTLRNRESKEARFNEFDAETFLNKFARELSDHEMQIKLALDGLHCAACIWLIEKLPAILQGVIEAKVDWSRGLVQIRWRSDLVQLSTIARALHRLGYSPHPVRESERAVRFKIENRKHLSRIGVAGALAGNNMIISASLYLGMFSHMSGGMTQLMRVTSCIVGLGALLGPGRVFLKSAWNAIRTRSPHMDLPIALALLVGTVVGTLNVLRGSGEIYFDSLAVLIFLLLVGRWLQFRQQSRAADSVELLYRLTPRITRKMIDGTATETLVDLVEVGDRLEILPGELFPVDGHVVRGSSSIDESILTGESAPVPKTAGDPVAAGTTNRDSVIVMEVDAVGNETRLSRIVELVEQSALEKPEIVQWANRVGGYFVVTVMVLAVGTFLYWLKADLEVAVDRSIALLIVACPCALALATPLALAVALGRAAKRKIMVKGGDVLQALQKPGMIWLDKTGTLTEGDLQVMDWSGDASWLPIVAELEANSNHPVARAIVRYAESSVTEPENARSIEDRAQPVVLSCQELPGKGISGVVNEREIQVGNLKLLEEFDVVIGEHHQKIAEELTGQGLSPCWIASDGRVVAVVALGDSIRDEAKSAVQQLKQKGWDIGILSGDVQQIVNRVALRLEIDPDKAIGEVEPEQKLEKIKESSLRGTVVMIGDGVNDSAALAAATVGLAVKNGAEASLAAAPVYLGKPGLNPVLELLAISRSTARTMNVTLAVSLAYNITFAFLAFAGFINPLVAAILMPISSLTVVSLSLAAGRTGITS